ncbi:MAG: ATP-binding protein [Myxococcota bacterium]
MLATDHASPDARIRALAEASRAFAEAVPDYEALLAVVARRVSEITGDATTVRLLDTARSLLLPVAAWHPDAGLRAALLSTMAQTQRIDEGLWKGVVERHEAFRHEVSADQVPAHASAAQVEFMRRHRLRAIMGVPLVARGRVLGAMSLTRYGRDDAYTDEDQLFLRDIADRAALCIDNAALMRNEREARAAAEAALADRTRAEEALRRTEEQLRASQKLEAIGRLAGGVAHDFNNVLSVILGYSELLLLRFPPGDRSHADLLEIQRAGERAAGITRQLLAFGRRQALEPRVLDVGEAIAGMERMLRRFLPEDVDLRVFAKAGEGRVRADPSQLEQVLLNLVLNARDAMPGGGTLIVESAVVTLDAAHAAAHPDTHPGEYVQISVTDSGAGMDRETLARLFEPFFTTKGRAQGGTGLGLATVFGVVKQSGGHIWVYSEPGRGTTFKIYLPRVDAPVDVPAGDAPVLRTGGGETVLVVEDEAQVRVLVETILQALGYRVLTAGTPEAALEIARAQPFDLLVTDVVLPGMNGRRLAEAIAKMRPNVPALYMSGYTENVVVHHGVVDPGVAFLQKPVTPAMLARGVRAALSR